MKASKDEVSVGSLEVSLDLKDIFFKCIKYWWVFALSVALAYGLCNVYFRYVTNQYAARAILLIKSAGKSGTISEKSVLLSKDALGQKSMDNEIQILTSLSLMEKVVNKLNLQISYFRIGNIKETELYLGSPFLLANYTLDPRKSDYLDVFIEMADYESFLFKLTEDDEGARYRYGETFTNDYGSFTIILNPKIAVIGGLYRMTVVPIESKAFSLLNQLSVERIGDQYSSSILKLSFIDPVAQKTSDIINELIDEYNKAEIEDENQVLRNTIDFINQRVYELTFELDSVEEAIQRFKSSNEIISSTASSSMDYTLQEIRTSLQEMSNYEVQENILKSLEKFLNENEQEINLIPANLIAENPILSSLVNQYNGLVFELKRLSNSASEINPNRIKLTNRIKDIRNLIQETIQNLQKDLQIPIQQIEKNLQQLRRSMSTIPSIEKKLVEQTRNQKIKENLYLFLLQKREETALTEAVTTAKTRVIDEARMPQFPIFPKRKLMKMVSILLGLFLPFLGVVLFSLLDNKVNTLEALKNLTSIPILGSIPRIKGKDKIVVSEGKRTASNEMFRTIRTNLGFINSQEKNKVIMTTSSISGEGKTMVTLNLAVTIALTKKKVAVVELDLRRPRFEEYLLENHKKGIVDYLAGKAEYKEIQHVLDVNENVRFIPCGTIPPNPAELLLSKKFTDFLENLRKDFDYVLLDTPPITLVSDAMLLANKVDTIILIVKQGYTRNYMIKSMEELYQSGKLDNASIVFNGVVDVNSYYGYKSKKNHYYVDEE